MPTCTHTPPRHSHTVLLTSLHTLCTSQPCRATHTVHPPPAKAAAPMSRLLPNWQTQWQQCTHLHAAALRSGLSAHHRLHKTQQCNLSPNANSASMHRVCCQPNSTMVQTLPSPSPKQQHARAPAGPVGGWGTGLLVVVQPKHGHTCAQ